MPDLHTSQKDKEFDRSSRGANAAMSHNQTLSYSITDLNNFINLELSKVGQALPDKSNN